MKVWMPDNIKSHAEWKKRVWTNYEFLLEQENQKCP